MPGPDTVPPEMRERLLTNRDGKLTGEQWKDMVSEPLVVILLLASPALMVLGPRLLLGFRGILFIAAVVLLVVMVPTLWRAFRYSRAPVRFAELYTRDQAINHLFTWQTLVLYTKDGKRIRFKKRLAPWLPLRANQTYIVYYLRNPKANVLLSLAPAKHRDVAKWRPSEVFRGHIDGLS